LIKYSLNIVLEDFPDFDNKKFFDHFPVSFFKINKGTVEEFSKNDKNYIYTIFIGHPFFHKFKPFKLRQQISKDCFNGTAKVLLYFPLEGHIDFHAVEWINEFAKLNSLNTRSLIYAHCNLSLEEKLKENNISKNFTYLPINYFEYNPWYTHPIPSDSKKTLHLLKLNSFIRSNRDKEIKKYFIILMRVRRTHRMLLFSEIKSNIKLDKKTDMSLGLFYYKNTEDIDQCYREFRKISGRHSIFKKNLKFLDSFDFNKTYTLDTGLTKNLADSNNRRFYSDYFCSITSETHVEEDLIFFSEKTFKPIINLQPFLLFSTQYSLKYLKDLGYKTFSDWWDESYDDEKDYSIRMLKITKVMEEIASWSESRLLEITQEMEQVLIHNYMNFFYNRRYENFISKLAFFENNQETNISYSYRDLI